MKKLAIYSLLGVALALGSFAETAPAEAQTKKSANSGKPLTGVVRPGKRGGYSYKYVQGQSTKKFYDPTVREQTPAGPFDSGFWFNSPGIARNGGDSPYMQ